MTIELIDQGLKLMQDALEEVRKNMQEALDHSEQGLSSIKASAKEIAALSDTAKAVKAQMQLNMQEQASQLNKQFEVDTAVIGVSYDTFQQTGELTLKLKTESDQGGTLAAEYNQEFDSKFNEMIQQAVSYMQDMGHSRINNYNEAMQLSGYSPQPPVAQHAKLH